MDKDIKYLIENIVTFNPVDYEDDTDIIGNQETTSALGYKNRPKTLEELKELVVKRIKENPEKPYLLDIDTSLIDDMSGLFMNGTFTDKTGKTRGNKYFYSWSVSTYKLKTLDLSTWDTSNVTDMSFMFRDCYNLETVILSNFDTSEVKDM